MVSLERMISNAVSVVFLKGRKTEFEAKALLTIWVRVSRKRNIPKGLETSKNVMLSLKRH